MADRLRHGFRLGTRSVYPSAGRIEGPDGSVQVRPEIMALLMCLVRRPGEVVKFGDILAEIWPDGSGSEEALRAVLEELRDHLGDSASAQGVIRLHPTVGLELAAEIGELDNSDSLGTAPRIHPEEGPTISELFASLRKRRVFRSVGAYAIFVWLLMQIADIVFPPLGVPDSAMTLLVWMAVLGFPIVAVLSWTFQVTEKGVVVDRASGFSDFMAARASPRAIDFAIIGVLVLIIGYLVHDRLGVKVAAPTIMTEQGAFELPRLEPGVVEPNSIAVLPFVNLNDDPRIEYLAMGLAEDVLRLLANIRELRVPSRSASFYFQGRDVDLKRVADQLKVKNVLEGRVGGPVEDMVISAELTDASDGNQVWSHTYTPRNADVLEVRDEIARSVVESLQVVLSVESQNQILARPTNSADAYDYYLQALSYLRRPRSAQTLDNAEGLFRRALDIDPEYALAYAGLCNTYLGKYRLDRRTEHVEPAERACNKALELDPRETEVHEALGSLYRHTGQYDIAEKEFQRAIIMNPKLEVAYYGLAMTYEAQGRLSEAEQLFHYAVDLEPGYWGTHLALGNYYLEYGQPEKAISPFRRVVELNPEYAQGYNSLGAALYNSGDVAGGEAAYLKSLDVAPSEFAYSNMGSVYYNTERYDRAVEMFQHAIEYTPNDFRNWGRLAFAERFVPGLEQDAGDNFRAAIELATKALEVNPKDWRTLAYLASYYANTGDPQQAESTLEQALALGPDDPHVQFFGAITMVALGDNEAALRFLERASRLGYATNAIASDPDFRELRDDEKFKALVDTD